MSEVELYHFPVSLYSAVARIALEEKGLKYKSKIVDIMKGEQYEESYMALNPNGTVPTLAHQGKVITGSASILRYIEEAFTGQAYRRLAPEAAAQKKEMQDWIDLADSLPMEVIIYGKRLQAGGPAGKVADQLHHSRAELLQKKLETCPEKMKEFYQKKLDYVAAVEAKVHDAALVEKLVVEHFERGCIDKLEATLKGKDYLVGNEYSLADSVWTLILQRLNDIGLGRRFWADGKRPSIEAYLKRMMARPSFDKAVTQLAPKPGTSSTNLIPGQQRPSFLKNPWIWAGILVAAGAVIASHMFSRN